MEEAFYKGSVLHVEGMGKTVDSERKSETLLIVTKIDDRAWDISWDQTMPLFFFILWLILIASIYWDTCLELTFI